MAEIRAPEDLWATRLLPEGAVERWLVADGAEVKQGEAVAQVRVEDALHDLVAPVSGRLKIAAETNSVIEPGSVLGTVVKA